MGDLDQISKAIGSLESSVKNLDKTQKAIWDEIKEFRDDLTDQKISAARTGGRMGVITAIATFGAMEGIKYYVKHH